MSVNQYHPKSGQPASNSIAKETTTMSIPTRIIDEQAQLASRDSKGAKIGFVSLGCPKNLVDSERILTQLRTEGYDVVSTYSNAELVIVNTCGFIDSAVQESLDTIGEALAENGKVIVTGCLGVKEDEIREVHPNVLAVTGPHAYEGWLSMYINFCQNQSTTHFCILYLTMGSS
jgi:ribosomal protein S12 methylthiotransferase